MSDPAISNLFQAALAHHRAGSLAEAERGYAEVLSVVPDHADSLHLLGLIAHHRGDAPTAIDLIARAVALDPKSAVYRTNLGEVLRVGGRVDEAIVQLRAATKTAPDAPGGHFNLGLALDAPGDAGPALASFTAAAHLDPRHAGAHRSIGRLQFRNGRLDEARQALGRALDIRLGYPEAHNDLGILHHAAGDLTSAETHLRAALSGAPDYPDATINLGLVLIDMARLDEALELLARVVEQHPRMAAARVNFANALQAHGDVVEAEQQLRAAIALAPNSAEAHFNLGVVLQSSDRRDEAIEAYRAALSLRGSHAKAHNNLGLLFRDDGLIDEAIEHFEASVQHDPDNLNALHNLGMARLTLGDFQGGWPAFEAGRWTRASASSHLHTDAWRGSDLEGRSILLHCEQGLGDNIQFIRFATPLSAKAAAVVVTCPQSLVRLFRTVPGVEQVVPDTEPTPPAHDLHASILSLPALFHVDEGSIPRTVPYLSPPVAAVRDWRRKLADLQGFKVGVAWRGNNQHQHDALRSLAAHDFAQALRLPGLAVVSLQLDAEPAELAHLGDGARDVSGDIADFADTAAVMANLDLVISVDTSVAHLAGALGRPVWTFLHFAADWRWMQEREDSPWYPTMRLFRQPRPGDWQSVVGQVRGQLQRRIAAPGS